jgi:hypothetical protein
VVLPEELEQIPERDAFRIELDLDGLGVVTEVAVGRLVLRPAGVADARAEDTGETPEPGVRTPESPEGERSDLHAIGTRRVRLHGLGFVRVGHDDSEDGEEDGDGQRREGNQGVRRTAELHETQRTRPSSGAGSDPTVGALRGDSRPGIAAGRARCAQGVDLEVGPG